MEAALGHLSTHCWLIYAVIESEDIPGRATPERPVSLTESASIPLVKHSPGWMTTTEAEEAMIM